MNLLIADDVGLGKTVEAGLIVRELLLRRRIETIVVAAPASMLLQWQDELAQKFGLSFTVSQSRAPATSAAKGGCSANPWSVGSRFIVSQAFCLLSPSRPRLYVHTTTRLTTPAPSPGAASALESQLTRYVREIAALFKLRL